MFLVVALENMDYLGKPFCVIMCYTLTAIKHKKLESKCQLENVQNNGLLIGGNLTSNIEINVLLNRRPMCAFHQSMAVLMFMDPVITVQKNFDHFYRSGARLLVQLVKSNKLT